MDKKILLVDDEPFILTLLEQTLEEFEEEGVILLKAMNGEDALRLAQTERPDLVFLDIMMPRLSGYEVCQRIKEDADLDSIYVVLLTARGQETDRERGIDVGADEYMTKPFDPDVIIQRTQEILSVRV
jgi:two-component system alkaline phosphatase synthesis response regulator PhoP